MTIPTITLLEVITANRGGVVEASLNDGFFNATHFFELKGDQVVDTGIDSQATTWNLPEFLSFYPDAYWRVDQLV